MPARSATAPDEFARTADRELRVRHYPDLFLVRHEFIKALVRAFAAEGIVIPFPVRALNLAQEVGAGAGADRGAFSVGSPSPPTFDEQ